MGFVGSQRVKDDEGGAEVEVLVQKSLAKWQVLRWKDWVEGWGVLMSKHTCTWRSFLRWRYFPYFPSPHPGLCSPPPFP